MKNGWLLLAAFFVVIAPVAMADTIQLTVNESVVTNISSPNDNYWGEYIISSKPLLASSAVACCVISVPFSNVSLSVPSGSIIHEASFSIILPSSQIAGTGYLVPENTFGQIQDPSLPSIAPTFSTNGISNISIDSYDYSGYELTINGNEVSSDIQDLTFSYTGIIDSGVVDPGSNLAGYVGGFGQVDIPYSVQLDVEYTPVPEPSTFALFAIGAIGLAGVARLRFQRQS
jgi:hypothetical protein